MGRSQRMSYGHAFVDWCKGRDGQEHPEWFQLREDGETWAVQADFAFFHVRLESGFAT